MPYEIALGPAAQLFIVTLGSADERRGIAEALRTELENSPNHRTIGTYDGIRCVHQVLETGHTAVFNSMSHDELDRFGREQHRAAARTGYYVYDILDPGSAIQPVRPTP